MRFGHPIGKRNDGLSGIHPADLSALTLEALVQRTRIDPALVDDVIPGAT
jgi:acetyl-CoA acyltransferase